MNSNQTLDANTEKRFNVKAKKNQKLLYFPISTRI